MDIKNHICESLTHIKGVYLKDLGWIPEDKLDVSPMAAAKTPKAMTIECAGLFKMLVALIDSADAKRPSPEERQAWYASFKTIDAVKEEFTKTADALIAKIEKLDPSALDREVTAPWGQPISLGGMLLLGISHTTYHDGQLNYIQTLYGDDKFHWME